MTRDRTLKSLCQLGVLRQLEVGRSHRSSRWQWVADKDLDSLVLPDVAEVMDGDQD